MQRAVGWRMRLSSSWGGWSRKTKNLTQISNVTTGKLDANAEIPDGKFPFFTCAPTPMRINTFSFDDDVVLLAGNNAQGNFHLQRYKGKFDAYQRTYVITAKKGYDIDYIKYSLELSLKHLKRLAQGSQTKFLTMQILDSFQVLDVPCEEQKTLIRSVYAIDNKIRLNDRICSELEAMAKTLYDYWFVQFDFPDENGNPYRTSGGEMVWNEQLKREIPKGWEVTNIGKITANFDSRRIPLSQNERNSMKGDIPYYGATGVMDYVDQFIFDGQYVLIAEDGSVVDGDGHPIVQMIWGKTWVNNHAHVLEGCNGYSNELLYFVLKDIPVIKIMTGSIQKKINQDNLNNYKIPQIPHEIANQFTSILKTIFSKLRAIEIENSELTKLRDWLLPMLMNGQARVE